MPIMLLQNEYRDASGHQQFCKEILENLLLRQLCNRSLLHGIAGKLIKLQEFLQVEENWHPCE